MKVIQQLTVLSGLHNKILGSFEFSYILAIPFTLSQEEKKYFTEEPIDTLRNMPNKRHSTLYVHFRCYSHQ